MRYYPKPSLIQEIDFLSVYKPLTSSLAAWVMFGTPQGFITRPLLEALMRIYGSVVPSTVDGPSRTLVRAVIHTAGCTVGCKGCFNPHTHAPAGENVRDISIPSLVEEIVAISYDVTISGGEPSDQPEALLALTRSLRERGCTIILYSGRTRAYWMLNPYLFRILSESLIDVLIDGPFQASKPEKVMMRGSENQKFWYITDIYDASDMESHQAEIRIGVDGNLTITGFPDPTILAMLD